MRELGQKILRSMKDRPVDQRPMPAGSVSPEFLYSQHAIEVPRRKQRRIVELLDAPRRRAQREEQRQSGKGDEHDMIPAHLDQQQGRARSQPEGQLEIRRQHDRRE